MQKPPDAHALTDPTYSPGSGFNALGVIALLYEVIFKNKIKLKRSIRIKEKRNKSLQKKFINNFENIIEKKFYIETLNIPEDEFYRFIDYCEGNGLIEYYKSNEFKIKDFLIKQAKNYNEIKN